jgi:hypothetical protein
MPRSHRPFRPAQPAVFPTEAQRSGGTCSCLSRSPSDRYFRIRDNPPATLVRPASTLANPLSSRPKRSEVEGPAVPFRDLNRAFMLSLLTARRSLLLLLLLLLPLLFFLSSLAKPRICFCFCLYISFCHPWRSRGSAFAFAFAFLSVILGEAEDLLLRRPTVQADAAGHSEAFNLAIFTPALLPNSRPFDRES